MRHAQPTTSQPPAPGHAARNPAGGSARYTRRQLLALAGGVFVVAVTPAALRRRVLARRSIPVMGTVASVMVAHHDRSAAERAIDLAFERLRWVDRTMSRFSETSDIGRVNRLAGGDAVPVEPETARVLAEALAWARRTGGEFDPALARVMEIWDPALRTDRQSPIRTRSLPGAGAPGVGPGSAVPPAAAAYARLAGRSLYRGVTVERWNARHVVRFDGPDIGIDLGGIAKGHAVDLAALALARAGFEHFVVDAGGDLRGFGRSADGDPWRVGVRSPADPDRIVAELELLPEGEAVATSGDYEQGFDFEGRRYGHIMDPARAAPRVAEVHSLTVRAATCLEADALATAGFGRAPAEAARLLARAARTAAVVAVA